ncbi:MAG: hypothetical protein Hyperionvirus24_26 [Hyperionvirus sp.]|uniref:Uncharacterized protein n=1 Tax=Hyperionvirus sp. TaxID=2487770 RepID=A0A3G5ACS5_9VIRU|nr:MAG: hypothetical protein Hyperionvirus24_26 [Hyperionvirus sp.]
MSLSIAELEVLLQDDNEIFREKERAALINYLSNLNIKITAINDLIYNVDQKWKILTYPFIRSIIGYIADPLFSFFAVLGIITGLFLLIFSELPGVLSFLIAFGCLGISEVSDCCSQHDEIESIISEYELTPKNMSMAIGFVAEHKLEAYKEIYGNMQLIHDVLNPLIIPRLNEIKVFGEYREIINTLNQNLVKFQKQMLEKC